MNIIDNYQLLNYKNIVELLQSIQNYNYILLGESTHGTEEFFLLRYVMTILLIKNFNFNTVLFEMEWSIGYQINLYIHSKINKDIKKFVNQLFIHYPKWMGNNEIIIKLILFLKQWNDTHNENKKVYFYGIDCQNIEIANQNICYDKNINCKIVQKIIKNYHHMKNSNDYWNQRDKFWLTIINHIKKERNSKFILWAHNSHIGNCKANIDNDPNKINIGYLLNKSYQSFKIGFSTYEGTVKASKKWDGPGRKYSLKKAHKDSFEYSLHLLTKKLNKNSIIYICNPKLKIEKLFRYVGVIYNSENEMNAHYQLTNINKEYNIVIFINKTNYLKQSTELKFKNKNNLNYFYKDLKKISNKI